MSLGPRPQPSGQSPCSAKARLHPHTPQQRRHACPRRQGLPQTLESLGTLPPAQPTALAEKKSGSRSSQKRATSHADPAPAAQRHPIHVAGRWSQEAAQQNGQLPREKPNLLGWDCRLPPPQDHGGFRFQVTSVSLERKPEGHLSQGPAPSGPAHAPAREEGSTAGRSFPPSGGPRDHRVQTAPRRPPKGRPRPQHTSLAQEPSVSLPGALWGPHFPRAPMSLWQDRPHGAWARAQSPEVL